MNRVCLKTNKLERTVGTICPFNDSWSSYYDCVRNVRRFFDNTGKENALYTVYPNICGQYGRSLHSGQLLYLKTRSPIISAAEEGADLPRRKEDS